MKNYKSFTATVTEETGRFIPILFMDILVSLLVFFIVSLATAPIYGIICGIAILILFIYESWIEIEEVHFGQRILLSKRQKVALREGPRAKWPFIERIDQYSYELVPHLFEKKSNQAIVATCYDGVNVEMEGSLITRTEFELMYTRSGVSQAAIHEGLRNKIEEEINIVAGQYSGDTFYKKREVLGYLIRSYLQLGRRPDFFINKKGAIYVDSSGTRRKDKPGRFKIAPPKSFTDYLKSLRGANKGNQKNNEKIDKLSNDLWIIPVLEEEDLHYVEKPVDKAKLLGTLDILEFYRLNITRIELMLQLETTIPQYSEAEETYAQDITNFNLSRVDFTQEVKDALESQRIAQAKVKAGEDLHTFKMTVLKELLKANISPEDANRSADAIAKVADNYTIISGSALPLFNLQK